MKVIIKCKLHDSNKFYTADHKSKWIDCKGKEEICEWKKDIIGQIIFGEVCSLKNKSKGE